MDDVKTSLLEYYVAFSDCTHPVAVVIVVQGSEQFLLVVTLNLGPDEHTFKLFFMLRIETMNNTLLSCTIALSLLYWILGICHLVPLTIGFVGDILITAENLNGPRVSHNFMSVLTITPKTSFQYVLRR